MKDTDRFKAGLKRIYKNSAFTGDIRSVILFGTVILFIFLSIELSQDFAIGIVAGFLLNLIIGELAVFIHQKRVGEDAKPADKNTEEKE